MALIVADPPNYLPPQVEQAEDVLLFVQLMDLPSLQQARQVSRDNMLQIQQNNGGGFGNEFRLVNGQYQPTLVMAPGQWQRWRVTHAGWQADPLDLQIQNNQCEMYLLAKDGIYIQDYPRLITVAPIPTAGRADIMVRCSTPGIYNVLDYGGTLLTLDVQGPTVASSALTPWQPSVIPDYLQDLTTTQASPGCSCGTQLQVNRGGGNTCVDGGSHCVNGFSFEPTRFLHTVALGSVVERQLTGIRNHPYHQHVYPFQLVGNIPGAAAPYFQQGDWHDVIMIEDTNTLTMRYTPTVHLGRVMLHCHRLDHEDQGMMAQEDVLSRPDGCSCEAHVERLPENEITSSPSPSPTEVPTPTPTAVDDTPGPTAVDDTPTPTTFLRGTSNPTSFPTGDDGSCVDSTAWRGVDRRNNMRDCEDVARNPDRRCDIQGLAPDTRRADEACPAACGRCSDVGDVGDVGETCIDSADWFTFDRRNNLLNCARIANDPQRRGCNAQGRPPDTRRADEACPASCEPGCSA